MQRPPVRRHAVQRMFSRGITDLDIRTAINTGEVIEEYPDDQPYPSVLVLAWLASGPIHVVIAQNPVDTLCIVVTAYPPDPDQWSQDFRRRKRV